VREIANFASNREYTALAILMEAHHAKVPDGLDIVLLPAGPHFHFSISNWVEGKKLPGHGKDQGFHPELVLNGKWPVAKRVHPICEENYLLTCGTHTDSVSVQDSGRPWVC
jgi:rRNA maturation protein Rpf1